MYPHRPDLLSLLFGVAFLIVGLLAVANPSGLPGLDLLVAVAGLAVLGGVGLVASLATGDVHRRAARQRAARAAQPSGAWAGSSRPLPPPPALDPVDPVAELMADPLFGPPIDPEELDRRYRETFGGDDPAGRSAGGEGAAGGTAG